MKLTSWLLLITSAILYPLPLIFSGYLWWLAFLFAVPLFYVATQEELKFRHGFMWGILAIAIHLVGVIIGIDGFTAQGGGIARSLPGLILICYGGLCGGTWFWITTQLKKLLKLEKPSAIIFLWTVTLWGFIFFLDRLVLLPFDRMEGYFAFHPILALATHPQLLMLMPFVGKDLLSLLMYAVSAMIALFLVQPNIRHACFVLLALLPWCISLLLPTPRAQTPEWINTVAALPVSVPEMESSTTQMEIARHHFRMIQNENPNIEIIILPESSFYCYQLGNEPTLCDLWSEQYLAKPMHVILGAFRWQGTNFRNSVHWIYNGKLQDIFDKRHAVALTERIPSLINISIIQNLFFQKFPQISASHVARPVFELSDSVALVPYICSELFFNEHPDDTHPGTTIVATTNDRWCLTSYVTQLMYLDARLKAIQWQRDILYISFAHAAYLDKYGHETPIYRFKQENI